MRYPALEVLYREVTNIPAGVEFDVSAEGSVDVLIDALIECGRYLCQPRGEKPRSQKRMRAVAFAFACRELGLPCEDKCMPGDRAFQPTGVRISKHWENVNSGLYDDGWYDADDGWFLR